MPATVVLRATSAAIVFGITFGSAAHAVEFVPGIEVKGLIDFRAIATPSTQSAEDRGLGKSRFGAEQQGDARVIGRMAEAALVVMPRITWDLTGVIVLTAAPEQRTAFDVQQAFLHYKPAPTGPWSAEARLGAFFPEISLENTGLAWTSPYTITPSAINTWVGQELRTVGGEVTVIRRSGDWKIAGTVGAFGYNDPTGTLLAWRGWSLSDRTTGLADRMPLPTIRIIRPTGALFRQAPYDAPFHEIDGKVGFYGDIHITIAARSSLSIMYYDNRADDRAFAAGQWAWDTSFWSAGLQTKVGNDIDLLVQAMTGRTTVVTLPVSALVDTRFHAAYALASKAWGDQRATLRVDWFQTEDRDVFPDDNREHGYAITLAYIFRPYPKQRLSLEFLYVDSRRPERQYQGLPIRAREGQFQVSYRFFL